jgi:nucleotide-binding universal stress UspA family protein
MTKKILLPYDGSEGARMAANYIVELVNQYEAAEVTVLTIGGPLFAAAQTDASFYVPRMNEQEYEKVADEGLALLADKGVRSLKKFRWIDPADEILREAQEGHYDLIVMGHRSARQNMRRDAGMLGSVAIKVINNAPCSVLIVRPNNEGLDSAAPVAVETLLTTPR